MQRFRSMKTLQKFSSVHAQVHNHFNQERHLVTRQVYKQRRSAALAEWSALAAVSRRLGLRLLRPTQTTCRCSDKARPSYIRVAERPGIYGQDRAGRIQREVHGRVVLEEQLSIAPRSREAPLPPTLRSVKSRTNATPWFPPFSKLADPISTGTRLPSLRKYSFSNGCAIPVILTSQTVCALRKSHSGGVRSVQLKRPDARSSRSYPTMRRNASFASRI